MLIVGIVESRKSRFIQLDAGQRRDRALNRATSYLQLRPSEVLFRPLFERNYASLRDRCLSFGRLGVCVVAVDTAAPDRIAGSCSLAARPGEPTAAIIGRHGRADLFLDGDASLSLRHLALLIDPLRSWDPHRLSYSVLDLRTQLAFEDENGRRLEGIVTQGPVFLRCGRYALFFLVTGDPTDFPADAADAWEQIPERIFIAEAPAEPDRWARQPPPDPHLARSKRATYVTVVPGPAWARHDGGGGEPPVAHLTADVGSRQQTLPVGERQLAQGIVVGRYDRCDGSTLLDDGRISRVHVLFREIAGRVWAIDTASTHRTYLLGDGSAVPVRVVPMTGPTDLMLGRGLARIGWRFA